MVAMVEVVTAVVTAAEVEEAVVMGVGVGVGSKLSCGLLRACKS